MAVFRSAIRDASDYSGPLLGFEVEAYAPSSVIGDDGYGEDEASNRTLRRVAKHLRCATRLPFTPIIGDRLERDTGKARVPNSSPANPVWGVTRDRSLEPVAVRNEYVTGIEVVTPPLSPGLSLRCLATLRDGMFPGSRRGRFVTSEFAGLHINASVPGLSREAACVAILNPYSSFVPSGRRDGFADTLFTAVVAILHSGADSPQAAIDAFLDLIVDERGWHPTNPGPLLQGRGYVEFRHLGSRVFQKDMETVRNLCGDIIRLLLNPPVAEAQRCAEHALEIARRVRRLDVENLLGRALLLTNGAPGSDLQESGFVNAVFDICLSDSKLSEAFPWVRIYGTHLVNPTGFNDVKMVRQIPRQSYYLRSMRDIRVFVCRKPETTDPSW